MKLQRECIPCLIETAVRQAEISTDDEELQFKAIGKFLEFLYSNLKGRKTPPFYGSERSNIMREVTSNFDPYEELKKTSNKTASKLKSPAEGLLKDLDKKKKRLEMSLKVAAAANSMEFGVSGYDFDPDEFYSEFKRLVNGRLGIDDSSKIASKILSSDEIVYLADNCGEIILDQILMEEIRDLEIGLSIGVKSKPVQEDVTLEVASEIGIERFGEVFATGGKVGLFLEDISPKFREQLEKADLIISKGMGNFETISEFEKEFENRLVYILRAKCNPVAKSFDVDRGELVIRSC